MSTNLNRCEGTTYGAKKQNGDQSRHIMEYKKNEARNGYAHLLTEVLLGDKNFKGVLEYLYGVRKEMEQTSYQGRNSLTIVPEDVAFGTGLSKRGARNVLSMLSSRDFPILRREGFNTYHLTDMGSACLSDISYRNNLEKLKGMNDGKINAVTDV